MTTLPILIARGVARLAGDLRDGIANALLGLGVRPNAITLRTISRTR